MGVFAFAAKNKSGTTYLGVHTNSYPCGFELHKTGARSLDAMAPGSRRPSGGGTPARPDSRTCVLHR